MSRAQAAADRVDAKWDVCRRCRHYRVEHASTRRKCRADIPTAADPNVSDPCPCTGFDPPR